MIIGGHDELQRLVVLYWCHIIPLHITSLSVNLTPTFPCEGCQQNGGPAAAMRRIQEDLNQLEKLFFGDWWYHHGEWEPSSFNTSHFSSRSHESSFKDISSRDAHGTGSRAEVSNGTGEAGEEATASIAEGCTRIGTDTNRIKLKNIDICTKGSERQALYFKPIKVTYPNSTLKEFSITFSSAHI